MIEFKKYSSIENHFYKDYLNQVREQVPADMQWVVQEKVQAAGSSSGVWQGTGGTNCKSRSEYVRVAIF